MKKESTFKMKGFSGFGNSPVKKIKEKKARLKDKAVGKRADGKPVLKDVKRDALRNAKTAEEAMNKTARNIIEMAIEGAAYKASMKKFRKNKKMDTLGPKKLKVNTKPRPQSSGKLKK